MIQSKDGASIMEGVEVELARLKPNKDDLNVVRPGLRYERPQSLQPNAAILQAGGSHNLLHLGKSQLNSTQARGHYFVPKFLF